MNHSPNDPNGSLEQKVSKKLLGKKPETNKETFTVKILNLVYKVTDLDKVAQS